MRTKWIRGSPAAAKSSGESASGQASTSKQRTSSSAGVLRLLIALRKVWMVARGFLRVTFDSTEKEFSTTKLSFRNPRRFRAAHRATAVRVGNLSSSTRCSLTRIFVWASGKLRAIEWGTNAEGTQTWLQQATLSCQLAGTRSSSQAKYPTTVL